LNEVVSIAEERGALVLTIDREARRNALNDQALGELHEAVRSASCRDAPPPIVIRGRGVVAFCAGSDVKELAGQTAVERLGHTARGQLLAECFERYQSVVIAAIEGYCMGGGLELALACDLRVCGSSASFGLPEIALGAIPSWGGTFRLSRLFGLARAKEMVLFGRRVDAEEALGWGLVSEIVEVGAALDSALRTAERISLQGSGALRTAKAIMNLCSSVDTATAQQLDYLADASLMASEVFHERAARFGSVDG
jgi:enoyl-CoA hydratase